MEKNEPIKQSNEKRNDCSNGLHCQVIDHGTKKLPHLRIINIDPRFCRVVPKKSNSGLITVKGNSDQDISLWEETMMQKIWKFNCFPEFRLTTKFCMAVIHWLIDFNVCDFLSLPSIDWLIWLFSNNWLIDWLTGPLIDWLIDRLVHWLIDWLIDRTEKCLYCTCEPSWRELHHKGPWDCWARIRKHPNCTDGRDHHRLWWTEDVESRHVRGCRRRFRIRWMTRPSQSNWGLKKWRKSFLNKNHNHVWIL